MRRLLAFRRYEFYSNVKSYQSFKQRKFWQNCKVLEIVTKYFLILKGKERILESKILKCRYFFLFCISLKSNGRKMLMAPSFDMEKAAENSTPYSKWWPWGKTPRGIVHLQAVKTPAENLCHVNTYIAHLMVFIPYSSGQGHCASIP